MATAGAGTAAAAGSRSRRVEHGFFDEQLLIVALLAWRFNVLKEAS